MLKPLHVVEVFLQPGGMYFGGQDTRIHTVLGSCVSLTFWHPLLRVGGMCHYMLPNRSLERRRVRSTVLDGRYADEAVALLVKQIDAHGLPYREYQVKLFGGGNMFPEQAVAQLNNIGLRNVEIARELVNRYHFNCVAEHLGGYGHRNVIFEVWSGCVWVRHLLPVRQETQGNAGQQSTQDWSMG